MEHCTRALKAGDIGLTLSADLTDRGVVVFIAGGTKEHVGGVAMSLPRESLSGKGHSCDTWILPVPGHKDTVVAEKTSARICQELNMPVVVTVGIHVDKATPVQIAHIETGCILLVDQLIKWAKSLNR